MRMRSELRVDSDELLFDDNAGNNNPNADDDDDDFSLLTPIEKRQKANQIQHKRHFYSLPELPPTPIKPEDDEFISFVSRPSNDAAFELVAIEILIFKKQNSVYILHSILRPARFAEKNGCSRARNRAKSAPNRVASSLIALSNATATSSICIYIRCIRMNRNKTNVTLS